MTRFGNTEHTTPLRRLARLVLAALALGTAPALAADGVEGLLSEYRTEEALTGFLGVQPRCSDLTSIERACAWNLGKRQASWAPLAKAVATNDRVNVVCQARTDGGERDADGCLGFPGRSNRSSFKSRPSMKGLRRSAADREKVEALRERARRELTDARNLYALVVLVGDLPSECGGEVGEDRACVWRLSARTLGHGTVAAARDLSFRKKLRLECTFGPDWFLRDDCAARVGN